MAGYLQARGLSLTIRLLLAFLALLYLDSISAHGDESHADEAPITTPTAAASAISSSDEPDLLIAKPLQRALAITTVHPLPSATIPSAPRLAEVVANPQSRARIQAPEAGRLRASSQGWPVAGRRVQRGELLAVLLPSLSQRDQAQRRVELAGMEQRQRIADINADRLHLQAQAAGGQDIGGNTYLEQAMQEAATLKRQLELLRQSLDGHVEIRAGEDGLLQGVNVAAGEVVSRGQSLFEISGGSRVLLSLRVQDAALTRASRAQAIWNGQTLPLQLAGHASAAPEPGWNLWLEFSESAPPLAVGTPVTVQLSTDSATEAALLQLPALSVQGQGAAAHVWLHVAPERFQRRAVLRVQELADATLVRAALEPGDRVVASGASLLDQYR